jgi:hypothetical protein
LPDVTTITFAANWPSLAARRPCLAMMPGNDERQIRVMVN